MDRARFSKRHAAKTVWRFRFILATQYGILKKLVWLFLLAFSCKALRAQTSSIATDVSMLRSVTKGSKFWAFGQTVQAQYHFTPKTTAYAWLAYYTTGNFKNSLSATARDSVVAPQRLAYIARSTLRYRHVSVGIKQYLKGASNNEGDWNLYSITGFGLLLMKAANTYSQPVDTTLYAVPQKAIAGSKDLVRLTVDIGLGAELLLGSGIYLYGDVRTCIQASRFPSPYLYNNAVPRVVVLSSGIRVLFD